MSDFASKYPSLAALLSLVGKAASTGVTASGSALQKIEAEAVVLPAALAFMTAGAAGLGADISAIKSDVQGEVSAVEYLVVNCAFSSDKAKEIIPLAFDAAEKLAACVDPIKKLVVAI